MAILNRAMQCVRLAGMSLRVLENAGSDPSNVARRDRGEATVLVKGRHISAVTDQRRNVEQPFGEEGKPQMCRGHTRPIEYLLAKPMVLGCFASRERA